MSRKSTVSRRSTRSEGITSRSQRRQGPFKIFVWDVVKHVEGPSRERSVIAIIEYQSERDGDALAHHVTAPLRSNEISSGTDVVCRRSLQERHTFAPAWRRLFQFVAGLCQPGQTPLLVSHNLKATGPVLRDELHRAKIQTPAWRFACSLTAVQDVFPTLESHPDTCSPRELARKLGLKVPRGLVKVDSLNVIRAILEYAERIRYRVHRGQLVPELLWESSDTLSQFSIPRSETTPNQNSVVSRPCDDSVFSEEKLFYSTEYGRLYHRDENCRFLRSAKVKVKVEVPLPNLDPCPKCCAQQDSTVAQDKPGLSSAAKAFLLRPYGTHFYKTRYGTKFHLSDDCRHLRNRIVLACRPEAEQKDPCRTCANALFLKWKSVGF